MIPFHFVPPARESHAPEIVLPVKLESKNDLFAFLAHAIPLPDYFGHNWDALEECLSELDWLERPQLVLVHRDVPLENLPADQQIYLRLLANAARDSKRLTLIFPEDCRTRIMHQLSSTPNR